MARPLLIAGVGNIFFGDDAFGCEVVRRLRGEVSCAAADVCLQDYGIRVRELGYALASGAADGSIRSAVIVDAVATGAAAGTLQLFDLSGVNDPLDGGSSHHSLDVRDALTAARALGAIPPSIYLLGCEPSSFDPCLVEQGATVLSPIVELTALRAVELLCRFLADPDGDLVELCCAY